MPNCEPGKMAFTVISKLIWITVLGIATLEILHFHGVSCFSGGIVFPGEEGNQIPEEVLIKMNDVRNVSEFISLFVPSAPTFPSQEGADIDVITGRKKVPQQPVAAGCIPEMQAVDLERPKDPSVVFWPMCVRVKRCGGCCTSKLLHCVPVKKSDFTTQIVKARYVNGGSFDFEGYEMVTLEQHDQCACECRQKREHCSIRHDYNEKGCRCVCRNAHEAQNCEAPLKTWDSEDCTCKCANPQDCSSGSRFNTNTCRCESMRSSRLVENPPSEDIRSRSSSWIKEPSIGVGERTSRYGFHPTGIRPDEDTRPFKLPRVHDDSESRKIRISDAEYNSRQAELPKWRDRS